MSESIPYLGSKISLISKSEIRYEGILYTIDAQDSIIALAKVQSFGTEDRPTEMPVPAKNDIYEYIIFRGTDIKKIEVCETPKQPLSGVHNDPAIVGLQVQQHTAPVGSSYPYNNASFGHQPLGPIGSVGSYYGNSGNQIGQNVPSSSFSLGVGVSQPSELSGGNIGGVSVDLQSPTRSQPIPAPIGAPPQSQQGILSGSRSRSSTPSTTRKSPVVDASVQVSPPRNRTQASSQEERKRTSDQGPRPLNQIVTEKPPPREQREQQQYQSRRGYGGGSNYYHQSGYNYPQQQSQASNQRHYQGGGYQNYNQQYQSQYRGGMGRGGRATRRPMGRGGRGGAVYNQGSRRPEQFDKDYDFEQANEEFEELRTQLAKTKISENGTAANPEDAESSTKDKDKDEKKDDSGHETATTGDESEDSSSAACYDKTKSFFDSISCEAIERSKGKSQRSDWRQERKINVQTFGVASARRGYYPRGRGGYYQRGSAGGGGGGYGYRNYNQGYYRNSNQVYRGGYRGNYQSNYNRNRVNGERGGPAEDEPRAEAGGNGTTNGNGGGGSYASALRAAPTAK